MSALSGKNTTIVESSYGIERNPINVVEVQTIFNETPCQRQVIEDWPVVNQTSSRRSKCEAKEDFSFFLEGEMNIQDKLPFFHVPITKTTACFENASNIRRYDCFIEHSTTTLHWVPKGSRLAAENDSTYNMICWRMTSTVNPLSLIFVFAIQSNTGTLRYITFEDVGQPFKLLESSVEPESIGDETQDPRTFYYKPAPTSSSGYLELASAPGVYANLRRRNSRFIIIAGNEGDEWNVVGTGH